MYNSTICLLLRDATWLIASLRSSTQRFVCYFASRHGVTLRGSARRSVTQRNDLFVTSRLHATSLNPTPRGAFQLNDLFVNLLSRLNSQPLGSPRRGTPHRTSTQRFVYYIAPPRTARLLNVTRLNSTQRFVCQFIITTRRSALLRHAPRRVSTRLSSTQRTET